MQLKLGHPQRARAAMLLGLLAGGCQTVADPALPRGAEAYAQIPPPRTDDVRREYRIGPRDVLAIRVFQEPELTFEEISVDSSGNLGYPLIGSVHAAGRTPAMLADELTARLRENFIRNPKVTVLVTSSVSQSVTVEGNVTEPGVYEIGGGATLLTALARARSTTRVAKLDEIVVFRTVDGQRMGAVFNLADIRAGRAPDPELLGGDIVVVGFSAVKGAFRDFLGAGALFNAFRAF
ncbi:polysaccharide biosynthesis/export family protein [Sphingomonas desiccabilis]|uniref:polysaccharide biosynthesis/export family protein n=1 Tax=Sphingomonas desiccabilis TaxID=429134 RepID=UPI0013ED51EA|nr:polysaccharide biosynthesis/export family protein [Sphingomonas desiccabilis]MBB3912718.1 polysaccharide export outer membrane protein [Sphingomonas desiccabilis]